jgi:carbon-monoxide dehydrogenase medium subunit
MVALGATMTVRGADGERQVPADEFFLGVYMTAAGPGELLTKISIPAAGGEGDGFAIVPIGKDGTAIVLAAACVRGNGAVESARVALGCVDAVPVRLEELESRLAGGETAESVVRETAKGTTAGLEPPSDVHASADYRRHLAEIVAVRAVVAAGKARR